MAKAEEASSNLERVTDYVEEKELDTERMAQVLQSLDATKAFSLSSLRVLLRIPRP